MKSSTIRNWVAVLSVLVIYLYMHKILFNPNPTSLKSSPFNLIPYKPDEPTDYSTKDNPLNQTMAKTIANRTGFKREGFFVECGAFDGVHLSNTLLLERTYGWTGLLVEADPVPAAILKKRNRHAWVTDACLSPKPHPMEIEMVGHRDVGGHQANGFIPNDVIDKDRLTTWKDYYSRKFKVQCFPLHMLLAAINQTEVDYLSLDVEGVELDILKTIPFDKITIKLISVEYLPKSKSEIKEFLESKGYKRFLDFKSDEESIHDDVYELQT